MAQHGAYGSPPAALASIEAGAVPYSPLQVGSAELEAVPSGSLASFTVLVPPGTIERRYTLALALRALKPGAPLLALGPKDKGGSRIRKELEAFGCEVEEESRAHHKICRALCPETPTGIKEATEEGAPRFLESLGLHTQPGVFSWERIDPGSALLLSCLPALEGDGADFGAGIGVLSRAALGSANVKRLTLVELDRRALACARKNLAGQKRASFLQADIRTAKLPLSNLDFVLCNPPFHDAGQEDRQLGLAFLAQAAHALKPEGALWLVANRHLPYEELLRENFHTLELRKEEGIFKVYRATR
jgi:16S rRNA (guanine1207-N2)-methyltransferase